MPLVQGLSQAAIKMLAGAVVLSEGLTEESNFQVREHGCEVNLFLCGCGLNPQFLISC